MVERPIVVLGDSTLAGMPGYDHLGIQLDIFTGAHIHHLTGVLDRHSIIIWVEIRNILKSQKATYIQKQFRSLRRATSRGLATRSSLLDSDQDPDDL